MTIAASAPLDGNVKPLALTMGDPAGIGGDITLKAWQGHRSTLPPFFVIDDPARLEALSRALNLNVPIAPIDGAEDAASKFTDALPVYKIKLKTKPIPGTPDPTNASSVISAIETAVRLVQNGDASAVVTNPIHKESLYGAGFGFPGHTEFLASLSGIDTPPVMMLVCSGLRVVPVTVHLGLREAIETLDADSIIT
ncbi:MAG: 4-hydroxythreonine-4-phosphate dehydrogenase PdxA, partial [Rhodospirillales bacterium]|nr:4-hydroxythreonine-4-phosphate dehydrogenase PdxA [Rhodospirillales bacterium]